MTNTQIPHPTYGYFTEMEYGILKANNLSQNDMKRVEKIKKRAVKRKKAYMAAEKKKK